MDKLEEIQKEIESIAFWYPVKMGLVIGLTIGIIIACAIVISCL